MIIPEYFWILHLISAILESLRDSEKFCTCSKSSSGVLSCEYEEPVLTNTSLVFKTVAFLHKNTLDAQCLSLEEYPLRKGIALDRPLACIDNTER